MKSFKFGNLAVMALSAAVLLMMITYTFGSATRASSSSLTHAETGELRQHKRSADFVDEDEGSRRQGAHHRGGKRRGLGKRGRLGLTDSPGDEPPPPANFTTTCECGKKPTLRLVGGTPTGMDAYPWQVALIMNNVTFLCGGTLINDLYVLTAAHCVASITSPKNITARLREYNLTNPVSQEINKTVVQIILHTDYESPKFKDDIALLKLDSKVVLNESMLLSPVCLPSSKSELYEGVKAIATGWGATAAGKPLSDVLREVVLKTETNDDCEAAGFTKREIRKSMICAGMKKRKGTCDGDAGGPLIYETKDKRYEQIGIASFDPVDCGQSNKMPAVFTRVTKYLRWIQMMTVNATYCTGFTFPGKKLPQLPPGESGDATTTAKPANATVSVTTEEAFVVPPAQCAPVVEEVGPPNHPEEVGPPNHPEEVGPPNHPEEVGPPNHPEEVGPPNHPEEVGPPNHPED